MRTVSFLELVWNFLIKQSFGRNADLLSPKCDRHFRFDEFSPNPRQSSRGTLLRFLSHCPMDGIGKLLAHIPGIIHLEDLLHSSSC